MATVFLSYRHEGDTHRGKVRALAETIENAGHTVILDEFAQERLFYGGGPNEGWPRWSKSQADNAAHKVLIVGSPGWFRCYLGTEVGGAGLGAAAEAGILEQRLYNAAGISPAIRIVHFGTFDILTFPTDLQRYNAFELPQKQDDLLHWLSGAPIPVTPGGAAVSAFPGTGPTLHWPLADHDHIRDAFAGLLTAECPHRGLLVRGPTGRGKTAITEQLLGNALRFPWLRCGRFDFKGTTRLREELQRFSSHLAVPLPKEEMIALALGAILQSVLARHEPTLLIFDTFETAGEAETWVCRDLLESLVRADHMRVVIAGQKCPPRPGAPWAREVHGPLEIGEPTVDDWFVYGGQYKDDLTLDFVRRTHTYCGGRAPLLAQILGPIP